MKSPKDVLALGQVIVNQLELASRGAVLERWLAHHLAEVLDEVDRVSGKAKAEAERNAVDLVLKLWLHRRALPEPADPLGGYRKAIEALGSLTPESNPWRRFTQSGEDEELLRDTFEALAKAVVFGLSLTHLSEVRAVTSEETAALSAEELELKKMLDRWLPFALMDTSSSELPAENDEAALRTKIIEEIKNTRQALGKLLKRWQREAKKPQG